MDVQARCMLLQLPYELLGYILLQLDLQSLLTCEAVCHLLQATIQEDVYLRYKIRLVASGMNNGSLSDPTSIHERLEMLESHQAAWHKLEWSSDFSLPALASVGMTWELLGGIFAHTENDKVSFRFTQLPSAARRRERRDWRITGIGFTIRDFCMDPDQDLLVGLETTMQDNGSELVLHVHMRTLSCGVVHPSACSNGLLSHVVSSGTDRCSYLLSVSGSYVGVLWIPGALWLPHGAPNAKSELVIWDWKKGQKHLVLSGMQRADLRSFTFIGGTRVVLGLLSHPGLAAEEPSLMVVDFSLMSGKKTSIAEVQYDCSLFFPTLDSRSDCLDITVRGDSTTGTHGQAPFATSIDDRLLVITLWILVGDSERGFLFFLPLSNLLKACESMRCPGSQHGILWDSWGPKGTRMITIPPLHSEVWVCYVFGMKYAVRHPEPAQGGSVMLYDFNPFAVRRSQCLKDQGHGDGWDVDTEHTIVWDDKVFEEPVTTFLPYRSRSVAIDVKHAPQYHYTLLSEDSLILVGGRLSMQRQFHVLTF